jgi:hypothetical protein
MRAEQVNEVPEIQFDSQILKNLKFNVFAFARE